MSHTITIPLPSDTIKYALTILVMTGGDVHLHGPIDDKASCQTLLTLAGERLAYYHQVKQANAEAGPIKGEVA